MKTILCSPIRRARPVTTARFSIRSAAHVLVLLFAGGVLTLSLHAQRGGQAPAAQPAGPRPATAPPLVPVRLDVDGNFRIAPPYANDPAFTEKPNVPKGRVVRFTMNSAESKIFPTAPVGGAGRGAPPVEPPQHQTFQRQVAVYIPAGYTPNTPAPFIVVQDGQTYISDDANPRTDRAFIPPMLDNLIYEKRIPSIVAVLVAPGPGPPAVHRIRHGFRSLHELRRDGTAAPDHQGLPGGIHNGS